MEENVPFPWGVNPTRKAKLTVTFHSVSVSRRGGDLGMRESGEKEKIQQRIINAEANMSQLDVIRCLKDRCINGGTAMGEGRAGKETEARVQETQIRL